MTTAYIFLFQSAIFHNRQQSKPDKTNSRYILNAKLKLGELPNIQPITAHSDMTTNLIKYEAARMALAECKSIDEVKSWSDKAAAMQAYGRMAKDKTLELDASEIRIRAERRLGELLVAQKSGDGLAKPGPKNNSVVSNDRIPTLKEAGISKDLSARAQNLAAVPEDEFEAEMSGYRERVENEGAKVTARLDAAGKKASKLHPETEEDGEPEYTELDQMRDSLDSMVDEVDRLTNLLAGNVVAVDAEERESLTSRMDALTAENKKLRAEVRIITDSRDAWQNQVAALKSQVSRQNKELAKLTGKKR